jgi:hypothetical protein
MSFCCSLIFCAELYAQLTRPVRSPRSPSSVSVLVSKTGSGTGTVSDTTSSISCGVACAANFAFGSTVTLTATPAPGSLFAGWAGQCIGTSTCVFQIDAPTSAIAQFDPIPAMQYTLTAQKSGIGSGRITSMPGGIDCGAVCSASFDTLATVALNAVPDPGSVFSGWSGACPGTLNTCSVTMNAAKTATAAFDVAPPTALLITTAAIFDGEVGFQSTQTLVVSNGTAPFTWSVASGNIPPGWTLNTAGVLGGVPTIAGNYSLTIRVQDTTGAVATKTFNFKINPAVPVQLPVLTMDIPPAPFNGTGILVSAGGDLQSALNGAACGSTIMLQPGAVYTGNFRLPNKNCNGNWITLRTQLPDGTSPGLFPPEGTRVTPADVMLMPKLLSMQANTPALRATSPGAGVPGGNYWRIIGLEITVDASVSTDAKHFTDAIVQLGQNETSSVDQPHHIIIDRCYVHGSDLGQVRRGVLLNGPHMAVINSNISNIHETGADSQAILGYNGAGPYLIENNRLEAAGENVLFGGAIGGLTNVNPSDITIRRNYFFKPLSWNPDHPTYNGKNFTVKNSLEFKMGQRALVDGNVFENLWNAGQPGNVIVITPRVGAGQGWPNTVTADLTFRNNIVAHAGAAFNIAAEDSNEPAPRPLRTWRIMIQNNLLLDLNNVPRSSGGAGGIGAIAQILNGVPDIVFEHNTGFVTTKIVNASITNTSIPANRPNAPFTMRNNLFSHGPYGIFCSGFTTGTLSLDNCFNPPLFTIQGTIMFDLGSTSPSKYPSTNQTCGTATCFPTLANIGLTDPANCNAGTFSPAACKLGNASPYRNAGTDGKDIGADITALLAATSGVKP